MTNIALAEALFVGSTVASMLAIVVSHVRFERRYRRWEAIWRAYEA